MMRRNISSLGAFLALSMLISSCETKIKNTGSGQSNPIEMRVDSVLSKMTLEQKVGQMTQLTIDVLTKGGPFVSHAPFELEDSLLDTVFVKYQIGSILNTFSNTPQTTQEWYKNLKKMQEKALANGGIPMVYGVDAIHGVTYTIGATLFPQQIGMGATFNPELVKQGAAVTAYETRASGIPWNFSPVLDLGRDARWSRMWETYSEDSYLVSQMGVACVEGYQGDDPDKIGNTHVASCLKHFMGYGVSVSGKDRTPSSISEQEMRERHFAPFLDAIKAGALSVMVNSGLNNGLPYHINTEYLTQWLKTDLNWDGVIVTDWADINNIFNRDKIVPTKKEAIKLAINAGIDMSMDPYDLKFPVLLRELVEEGEVKMERIDDAVRRILRMKFRLGLFDEPLTNPSDYPLFGSEEHAKLALSSAEESITLLKNEDSVLPLLKNKRVLVAGPAANTMRSLNGGWTLSWQGEKADQYASDYNTILEAIQTKIGKENVIYEPGVEFATGDAKYYEEKVPQIDKAVTAARSADYIILCLGENSYCETPGNLNTLDLSENQRNLAKALAKTGKPVILVLAEGRPRVVSDIEPLTKGVVQIYYPGNYGGDALANILWGDVNPSGKLPYTYPLSANSLLTYDYKPSENTDVMAGAYNYDAVASVQWAFGYGLSYTKFEYSNLRLSKTDFTAADELTFEIDVKNTGARSGKEVAMLFVSDLFASLSPDNRRLRAFEKIQIEPGETKTVTMKIKGSDLAFVGQDGKWILEKGDFKAQIGTEVVDFKCTETKKWDSSNR